MKRNYLAIIGVLAAGLAGCDRKPDRAPDPVVTPAAPISTPSLPVAPPPTPAPTANPSDLTAPVLIPAAGKGEKGARNVLLEWARAVERRDWARAAAQWNDQGEWTAAGHAARLARLGRTTVTLGEGAVEGGAGSLYYEVPVSIAGQGKTLTGRIVLRRVNDVDGASPAQLRWHIAQLNLEP
jgi:hypothetical protein